MTGAWKMLLGDGQVSMAVRKAPLRAITLENQLVILETKESDAGAYYVQAVNERNGENKTSPFIHLSIAQKREHTMS
ncbi:hypothetical protein STEG23_027524 [Scotinomys teguina]